MEHILCFTEKEQAEKALAAIKEKIDERSRITEPEKDGSRSVHFATDWLLTEQHEEIVMTLGAEMMILNDEE